MADRDKQNNNKDISRREFLKDAGLVVGGATVGTMSVLNACSGATQTVTGTVTSTITHPTTTTITSKVTTTTTAPPVTTTAPPVTQVVEKVAAAGLIEVTVNGYKASVMVEPNETLAEMLRERLNLTGTKIGCDRGTCGACVVHVDGRPVLSCMMLAIEAGGKEIITIEGLASKDGLHPLQQAVQDHTGFQCGFCTPGLIMETKALLDKNPSPTVEEIKSALGGHICRCGSFYAFMESVTMAGGE
jgi:aerobic-type carbon monoxide dehydrogenase small subunit (CoxS/CutS family)